METRKLYDEKPYQRTFFARVMECEQHGENYEAVLNQTAFFPEGGGQPCDTGVLNFAEVSDVQIRHGVIYHTVDRALPVGGVVSGGIDWTKRFARMQQHTGEHIISGIAHRMFGVENVGFHMGSQVITVDWNGELTADQLELVERLANGAVYRDVPVRAEYPASEELEHIDYRSKKELTGAVRIVTIPGYDVCACCGTHVARTGEIGAIKILSSQRYKGGTRITMVCGAQAMADYSEKLAGVTKISGLLSAKPEEVASAVERMLHENTELKREISELQTARMEQEARGIPEGCGDICCLKDDLPPELLRRTAVAFSERCGGIAAVFSGSEETGYRYAMATVNGDVRPLGKELNAAFSGRGGGPGGLVQGSLSGGSKDVIGSFFISKNYRLIP